MKSNVHNTVSCRKREVKRLSKDVKIYNFKVIGFCTENLPKLEPESHSGLTNNFSVILSCANIIPSLQQYPL